MKRPDITPGEWEASRLATPSFAPEFGIYGEHSINAFARIKGDKAREDAQAIAALPDCLLALEACMLREDIANDELGTTIKAALAKAGYTF